ncbi:MAG: acetyl-CoA C-acyltransferase [Cytophagaceae bacterium]|nr:acetyl-CoA C-acyltransferase [Cytophagaceae bacterium]
MKEIYIISAVRTPIGSFMGTLSTLTAPQLGAIAIKGAIKNVGIDAKEIQEVLMGNVLTANVGQAPARQAAIFAGLGYDIPCTTINKVCASGSKAIMLGAQSIMLGQADVVIAGGMESMSNVPYYLDKARSGYKLGHGQVIDGLIKDGLWDVYNDFHMGNAAELTAKEMKITREMQDAYAIESYKKSANAVQSGMFKEEIVPVEIEQKGGSPLIISEDEEYKKVNFDKIPSLKPVFQKDGTVTAANASTLNDGAAAVILMSKEKAEALGVKPLAKILAFADAEQKPEWFTTTPSLAIPKALKNAKLNASDVDYYEINEAFSVVSIANNMKLNLDPLKVNIFGGAVSLGHPIGCSGARIVTTLVNVLNKKKARIGVTGICNGGGGASAIVIERV